MKRVFVWMIVSAGLLLTSCYKDPQNGIAKMTVLTSAHFRQAGADIHLYGPAGSNIDLHGITDFNGEFVYEHDPALEVILNVHATYTDASSIFHEVHGLVRITPGKTANETYVLNP